MRAGPKLFRTLTVLLAVAAYGLTARAQDATTFFRIGTGPAADTLDDILDNGNRESYEFAFIDADKTGYDGYYERCLALLQRILLRLSAASLMLHRLGQPLDPSIRRPAPLRRGQIRTAPGRRLALHQLDSGASQAGRLSRLHRQPSSQPPKG